MSKIALTPNVSGTGTLTIAAPNTNTDRTLTLPDEAGTVLVNGTNQNVGIGTTSPQGKLNVQSSVGTSPASFDAGQIFTITNDSQSPADNREVTFGTSPSGGGYLRTIRDMSFVTVGTERARIDASGNLLVGTTSGSERLKVFGSSAAAFVSNFYDSRTDGASGAGMISFTRTSGGVGSINTSTTSTQYATSSDYRLKENVAPMQNALDTVAQLNPVTYTWKADGSAGQGFIAHELQAVVPDCVTGEKDAVDAEGNPQYQGVDTSFLVATLVKAIQEQQAQIEDLKAEIAALKGASA